MTVYGNYNVIAFKSCIQIFTMQWHIFLVKTTTLESGIDVAPGKNVAPGTFGKNNKRNPVAY